MISKTFEWYRIVSATPSTQAVEARTKAATELFNSLPKQDGTAVLALAQGVARNFDGSQSEEPTIEWLLRTLKLHDPAVSENLSENGLELRCIAAITLGELLLRSKEQPQPNAIVAAAAFNVIEVSANARRKPIVIVELQDKELAITDVPTAKTAILGMHTQISGLKQNAAMDREEINLFWFIASGFSRTKNKPFAGLPLSVAAVHAALEVQHFVLIPPASNCFEILAALVENKRDAEELKPLPLKDFLAVWGSDEFGAIAAANSPDADLASRFPAVFPVTWIANRMRETQSLPKEAEFNTLTSLRLGADLSATELSRQLLCEKVSVSLAGDLFE